MSERPERILIVDDEPLNVDYLEQELERLGFATESASNGLEALERVAVAPPDLVLLDVMMPELDGISALRILKGDPETRMIPVILMTALNAVEDRVRGIEAGADDFLSKPVDDRELVARIRTSLSLKHAIDETMGELRSTSAHLERFGSQERDVAVLAIDWRLRDATLPDDAVAFVGRRHREAAEERVRELGGTPSESDGRLLVAVFDGPDPLSRSVAAVEAANAVLEEGGEQVTVHAAITAGAVRVGSTRTTVAGEPRWAFKAQGALVDQATHLARGIVEGGVVAAGDAAAAVGKRFSLEPAGGGAHRVLAPKARPPGERSIKTILVTDIVESTRTADQVGDRTWGELLAAHERSIRDELVLFGGEEIDTTGDGFLAAFDSAARAIQCALAVRDRVAELGLTIRTGLHTGEIERVGGKPRGIALHIASRIAARANAAEVLVSATTRELAAGAGLTFSDQGEHTLRGVSEPRRLYAVES